MCVNEGDDKVMCVNKGDDKGMCVTEGDDKGMCVSEGDNEDGGGRRRHRKHAKTHPLASLPKMTGQTENEGLVVVVVRTEVKWKTKGGI